MTIDFTPTIETKQTGKLASTDPSGQTNVMGQLAQIEQQQTLGDLGGQAKLQQEKQAADLASIAAEGAAQQHAMDMDRTESSYQRADFVQKLMAQTQASDQELGARRDSLHLEAAAHNLMMADETYVQQLRDTGRRRRLNTAINFDEEMNNQIYGEELNGLIQRLGWDRSEAETNRSFVEQIANMNLDEALAIVSMGERKRSADAMGEGLSNNSAAIGEGASKYYGEWTADAPTSTTPSMTAETSRTTGVTPI